MIIPQTFSWWNTHLIFMMSIPVTVRLTWSPAAAQSNGSSWRVTPAQRQTGSGSNLWATTRGQYYIFVTWAMRSSTPVSFLFFFAPCSITTLPFTVQVSLGGMASTRSPVWMKPASIFPVTQKPEPWSESIRHTKPPLKEELDQFSFIPICCASARHNCISNVPNTKFKKRPCHLLQPKKEVGCKKFQLLLGHSQSKKINK